MNYLEYIRKNAGRIGVERQNPFTIEEIYGQKMRELKAIGNSRFHKRVSELSGVPMTRDFVRNSFTVDTYDGFVTSMLWGGLGLSNMRQLVDAMTTKPSDIESKISNLQSLLDEDMIQNAFMSLQVSRDNHYLPTNKIEGIDISYFTKLLYFLYKGTSATPPIIFDKWGAYMHVGILISQNEIDLLNTYYKMGYDKRGKFYVAIKSNRTTGYRYSVYADYLQRMANLSSQYSHSNPGMLEEFLFGKDLKHRVNKSDENPRFFVLNYVRDYYDSLIR